MPTFDDPEFDRYILTRLALPVDEQALDVIERGADRVLADVGIRLQDADSIELLRSIGADVSADTIRLDGTELRHIIRATAPARFRLRGRNPDRDTWVGGGAPPVFAPIYGAPEVLAPDGRRVRGNRALYRQLVEISHATPGLNNTGQMICVIDDAPEPARPLEMLRAHLAHSDKPCMGNIASPAACAEIIELTQVAVGRAAAPGECNLVHLINCTPPLTWWENPLKCLRVIAERGEASLVSSYMMLGASGPVTPAGALIQGYAEVLVGLALSQLWRPGAPVAMGILGFPFDMQKMLPNFGDPVSLAIQHHAAALGRSLGVPVRGDGAVTSSKLDDAQAGAESGRLLSATLASGADFVLHAAGWLQQGRCVSIDKLKRDADWIARECFPTAKPCQPPAPLDPAVEREIDRRIGALA